MIDLRAATPDDATTLLAIYAPYVVTNGVSFESVPPPPEVMRERIAGAIATHPWIVGLDRESGVVLGYAAAKPLRPGPAYRFAVETACYIAADVEGQGFRRILYNSLIATLIAQGFTQAVSTLTLPQDRVIQLHEALGFRRAGVYREISFKNGHWVDVGIWQRDLAQPQSPPDEPRGFADVGVVARG